MHTTKPAAKWPKKCGFIKRRRRPLKYSMRVSILVLIVLLASVFWFYELRIDGIVHSRPPPSSTLAAVDFVSGSGQQCFRDEAMICSFMHCNGQMTRELLSNTIPQSPCLTGVAHRRTVESNFTQPQPAGVTMYPDRQHVNDADACERWFNAGNAHQLIREYIQRAIPATGISPAVTYQRSLRTGARFLVVYACATLHSERRRAITTFNLRRLKSTLGENATYIMLVEATDSTELYADADATLHAEFVSPKTFYDAAAFQEGILEAFRLFGRNLAGFTALLILNDSVAGPWVNLNAALDSSSSTVPTLIGFAVWQNVCVSGSGLIFNRAAFESQAFEEYWRFVRFPCGKWSAMLLYEGAMVQYLMRSTPDMRCLTFTNDIHALQDSPAAVWRDRGLPFYKHKQDASALNLIAAPDHAAPASDFPLETCMI